MVHATDCVQYPELIPRADGSIRSPIALEGRELPAGNRGSVAERGLVSIIDQPGQRRPQIMRVHPVSLSDGRARDSDGYAVLHDLLIDFHGPERDLVPRGNTLPGDDSTSIGTDSFAFGDRTKRHRDVICVGDP